MRSAVYIAVFASILALGTLESVFASTLVVPDGAHYGRIDLSEQYGFINSTTTDKFFVTYFGSYPDTSVLEQVASLSAPFLWSDVCGYPICSTYPSAFHTNGVGTYWNNLKDPAGGDIYFEYYWDGATTTVATTTESFNGAMAMNTSFVDIVLPYFNTYTTSSTTVEIDFLNAGFGDHATVLHYEILDAVTKELYITKDFFIATSVADGTLNDTVSLADGSKFLRAWLKRTTGATLGEQAESFFHVATNTYFSTYGIENPYAQVSAFSQIDCSLFDIGCQFQKAIVFLTRPESNNINRYSSLWQGIRMKPPFGYVTVTITQLESLTSTSSPTFALGDIPFMEAIFSPFRIAVGSILWVLFFIAFYRYRLRHLDI